MVTVLTQFIAKDLSAASKLKDIFQKIIKETPFEQGYIWYEILQESDNSNSFYIFEKWASQEDLDTRAKTVTAKGYVEAAVPLLANEFENILLQSLYKQ